MVFITFFLLYLRTRIVKAIVFDILVYDQLVMCNSTHILIIYLKISTIESTYSILNIVRTYHI